MDIYLAVLGAAILFGLFDYVRKDKNQVFTKKYFLTILSNILAGSFIIWMFRLGEAPILYDGLFGAERSIDITRAVGALCGTSGQILFIYIMNMLDREVKTRFGLNKKD